MKNPYLYTDMSLKHVFILSLLWVTPSLTRMFAADETPVATDTIFFDDGSWYLGQVSDSLFNGYGKMVYPDSTVYEGEWKDGLWDGNGEIFYSDGDHYKGDFREHELEPGIDFLERFAEGIKNASYPALQSGKSCPDYCPGAAWCRKFVRTEKYG